MSLDDISVGIDGLNLGLARGTGVATYARTLGRTLAAYGRAPDLVFGLPMPPRAPRALRETLFFAELGKEEPADISAVALPRRWPKIFASPLTRQLVDVPVEGRVRAEAFVERLPPFSRLLSFGSLWSVADRHFKRYRRFLNIEMKDPPAVMHWTYPVPIHLRGAINIYTIHDLVPLLLPHTSLENKRLHDRLLRMCIDRAPRICTVSDASRDDILKHLGGAPDQIVNCYQSIDPVPVFEADDLASRLRALFDLEAGQYFLYFGAIEPKKNVGRLIEAYLTAEPTAPLIIVGGRAWRSEQELRLLGAADGRQLPGVQRIRRLDYLPRRMLDQLIAGAKAVLFPSLYEGFGLPVVEALARGVPVLTSNAGSLPEVAGYAAIFADPYDIGGLAQAIRTLDRDGDLRAMLSKAGPLQADRFTADRFARRLESLYKPLRSDVSRVSSLTSSESL